LHRERRQEPAVGVNGSEQAGGGGQGEGRDLNAAFQSYLFVSVHFSQIILYLVLKISIIFVYINVEIKLLNFCVFNTE